MTWIRKRSVTNRVRWLIDNLLPPIVSDSRWFNWLAARALYGRRPLDLDYKEKVLSMTAEQIEQLHCEMGEWTPTRSEDTTAAQSEFVTREAEGPRILEIGCGSGGLAVKLAKQGLDVTACDLKALWIAALEKKFADTRLDLRFLVANAECLPWPDKAFDTVVSTHTLEHIPNLRGCLDEIDRVAAKRVVIVVPCQRYKRYTIDTHVHFFPTEAILRWSLGLDKDATCKKVDGDWAVAWEPSHAGRRER